MKKCVINNMFWFFLGIILCSGVVFASNMYKASDIIYTNDINDEVKNVNEALDDLNNKTKVGNATSEDIVTGKNALVQGELIEGTGSINVPILQISTGNDYNDNNYNHTEVIYDVTKSKKIVIDDMWCQYNILNSVYIYGSKDGGSSWTTLKVISSAANVVNYNTHEYNVEIDISEYDRLKFYIRIATTAATYGFGYKGISFY